MIKAGVVAVNRFVRSGSREFASYIDYLDRNEAVRNENFKDFNLFNDYMDQPEKSTGIFTDKKSILTDADKKNLKNLFQIAYENHSLMWQTVISFDNKWLQEHGVYNAKTGVLDEEKMKELTRGAVNSLLESENLSNAVSIVPFQYGQYSCSCGNCRTTADAEAKRIYSVSIYRESGRRVCQTEQW